MKTQITAEQFKATIIKGSTDRFALGVYSEAIRYYKILNRIEAAMWNFKSENVFKSI